MFIDLEHFDWSCRQYLFVSRNRVRYSRYRITNLKSICRRIRKNAFSFLMFRKSMFPFNNDRLNFTRNQYSSDVLLRTWIPTIAPMLAANTKTKTRLEAEFLDAWLAVTRGLTTKRAYKLAW